MKNQFSGFFKHTGSNSAGRGQKGSIILIVLMLLVIMSLIGVASTNTTITENFIVRNSGIRKQNLHLVDAVAMEAYQVVYDSVSFDNPADPDEFLQEEEMLPGTTSLNWVHSIAQWETNGNLAAWYDPDPLPADVGPILLPANSEVPQSIIDGDINVVNERGEWDGNLDNSPVRYALVGWEKVSAGGESIAENKPGAQNVQQGNILIEYLSENFGVIRLIVGIRLVMS